MWKTFNCQSLGEYSDIYLKTDVFLLTDGFENLQIRCRTIQIKFILKGIRGGVAMCTKRAAKANNKFISSFYPSEPSKFIMYLDATNLYGAAMSEPLPQSEFRWVSTEIDFTTISDDNLEGYIPEVDLEYPEHLHFIHNDFPL